MSILINICDHATGVQYSYMLQISSTLRKLKEMFIATKGFKAIKVEDICAWTTSGVPLENDDKTLVDENLAINDIVINMATDWTDEILYYKDY